MRIPIICAALTLLIAAGAAASDQTAGSTCPSSRAAEAGYNPFEEFHAVMAPAWHQAWPDSNFADLFAAGPKFQEAFGKVAEMKPALKSAAREKVFAERRAALGGLVQKYAAAAAAEDKDKVYALMPELHDAFEQAASALLPVHYPEFEGMVVTLNLILETHLPKGNTDGVNGSTETLVEKLKALTPETLPEDLREHEAAIGAEFGAMSELAARMQKCCENRDMETYREHIKTLDGKVKEFIAKYI